MSDPTSANAATSQQQSTADTLLSILQTVVNVFANPSATGDLVAQALGLWTAARAAVSTVATGVAAAAANKTILAANAKYQDVPLTPALLADAVIRNILADTTGDPNLSPANWPDPLMSGVNGGDAVAEAALSGISGDRFRVMVEDNGESYGIIDALRLFNRGGYLYSSQLNTDPTPGAPLYVQGGSQKGLYGITEEELYKVIAYSRVRNQFADDLKLLSKNTLSPADAVEIAVKQIMSVDQAQDLYAAGGGMPEQFHMLVDAAGDSAGVEKAVELAAHGVLSQEELTRIVAMSRLNPRFYYLTEAQNDSSGNPQAYLAPLNRKWLPPYEIKEAVAANPAIIDKAKEWLLEDGYAEDQANAFVNALKTGATTSVKHETEAMILAELQAGMITQADATTALTNLGYAADAIPFLLDYAQARAVITARTAAMSRIRSGFLAYLTDEAAATASMTQVGVPPATITALLADWTAERAVPHTALSVAEIGWFLEHGTITAAQATNLWRLKGLTADDATLMLQRYPAPAPTAPPNIP